MSIAAAIRAAGQAAARTGGQVRRGTPAPTPVVQRSGTSPVVAAARTVGRASTRTASGSRTTTRRAVARATPPRPQGVNRATRRRAAAAQTPRARQQRAALDAVRQIAAQLQATGAQTRFGISGSGMAAQSEFDLMGQRATQGPPEASQQGPRAEFSGLPFWAQGNVQQSGGWLQGLANNLGGEAVGMAMGIPSFLQLAGQTVAYPGFAAASLAPGRFGEVAGDLRESTEDAWQAAGSGIAQDYATRWGPLFRGDIPEFGRQVYRNPGATLLDLTGAGALIGRAPNVAARATARTAPAGSALRARAERFTSIRAPGEALLGHALPDGMAGNRYRPDKVRRGTAQGVTKDKRTRVESAEVRVPQRPYSANVITRGAQKAAGRAAESVGRRAEAMADRLQVAEGMRAGWRPRAAAAVTRPLTGQAKFNRAQRKAVRELVLRRNQESAAAYGAISRDYNRAVSRLQRDKNAAGVQVRGLGTEHLAARLHLEGILTPRAGMSPAALRDLAVARMRRGIEQRRKNGERVEAEAIQVERLASITAELLELKGNAPAVRRVREAVETGRKLDKKAQDFEVESGVVTQATREGRQSLPSRVLLAGQDDAEKVIARLRDAGMKPEARQLRVAATADDPKVVAARGKLEKAEARLAQVSGKADRTAAMARVKDARRAVREAEANQRWRVAGARQQVEKARRTVNVRTKAAREQARADAASRRKAAGMDRPQAPTVARSFNAGERSGKASRDLTSGSTRQRTVAATRVEKAQAERTRLVEAQSKARAATAKYEKARVDAARVSARPLTAAQEAKLRAPLRAAERDLARAMRETPTAAKAELQRAREALASVRAQLGGTGPQVKAATRKRDKMKRQYDRVVDEALAGALTPPTRPQLVGHDGVYIPHIRPTAHRVAMTTPRGMRGPAVPKRSKGNLIADGVLDWNPALLSYQARRATDHRLGPVSREALAELIDIAAFTDKAGRAIVGKRAVRLAQTDPNQVALVSADGLRKALSKLDELEPGKTLTRADIQDAVIAGKELVEKLPATGLTGKYVAISKAAADEFTGTMRNPNRVLDGWDAFQDYWKGAILALSPRWYVNSTFGAGLQYGLLTGGDFRSIRRANRKGAIREAIPNRDAINTLAQDVGFKGRIDANLLQRGMTRGFRVNNSIETVWRRAAYLNRAKKHLKNEGVRTRGLSDAELAHAIETMPPTLARQITREIDLYMGEFRKFSQFEQAVLRRFIPFYSWFRVITKLTLSLPFRSPARAAALMVGAKMATAGINPGDPNRPWYDRGAWVIPGTNIRVRTAGMNSFATVVPFIAAFGQMRSKTDWRPFVKELATWLAPGINGAANYFAGQNDFGSDLFVPRGASDEWHQNPITGEYYKSEPTRSIFEAVLQSVVPGQAGPLRRALAAGETPYDTTTTVDLLQVRMGLKDRKDLFYEPRGDRVNEKVGPGGAVSSAGGFLGFPVVRENPRELERRNRDRERDARRAARRREREERRG